MLRGEGRVSVGRRGPSLLVCRLVGALESAHVEWLLREIERHMADKVRVVFIDADRLQSCAPPFADTFGAWGQRHESNLDALHVLGGSSTIDAQITELASKLKGPVAHHTEARPFRAAMLEHIGS